GLVRGVAHTVEGKAGFADPHRLGVLLGRELDRQIGRGVRIEANLNTAIENLIRRDLGFLRGAAIARDLAERVVERHRREGHARHADNHGASDERRAAQALLIRRHDAPATMPSPTRTIVIKNTSTMNAVIESAIQTLRRLRALISSGVKVTLMRSPAQQAKRRRARRDKGSRSRRDRARVYLQPAPPRPRATSARALPGKRRTRRRA